MNYSSIESLKIKAKLLQKAKKKKGIKVALKDIYYQLANLAGYKNWKELKDNYEYSDIFNPPKWSAQWKTWYSSYEEALKNLKEDEFLMPYHKNYFICDKNYLMALGIHLDDKDLSKVGNDFSNPKDKNAFKNLLNKLKN